MEKYNREYTDTLMKGRGYSSFNSYQNNKWSRLIDDIGDDCFWIFAHIDTTPGNEGIELSSNVLKGLITMQTPYIQIDHPNFEIFENKLIKYITACMQEDAIENAIYQRQQERKNK